MPDRDGRDGVVSLSARLWSPRRAMTVAPPGSTTELRAALTDWLRAHSEEYVAARAENEPVAIEDAMR